MLGIFGEAKNKVATPDAQLLCLAACAVNAFSIFLPEPVLISRALPVLTEDT